MRQDFEELFSHLKPAKPPAGLFDRIILAIKREQERQHTKRLLFGFLFLLVVSFIATPLSWIMLLSQAKTSGTLYFISSAVSDFHAFLTLWQNFTLAILESLPLAEIVFFAISLGISVFTLRLFLYNKRSLIYFMLHA